MESSSDRSKLFQTNPNVNFAAQKLQLPPLEGAALCTIKLKTNNFCSESGIGPSQNREDCGINSFKMTNYQIEGVTWFPRDNSRFLTWGNGINVYKVQRKVERESENNLSAYIQMHNYSNTG